jgi:hypothetical protein
MVSTTFGSGAAASLAAAKVTNEADAANKTARAND